MRKIAIIGGGLAGLISSIQLVRSGIPCTVIEKKSYPFHRVCGEYVSNEALPFLKAAGLYPEHFNLPRIKFLEFSSITGNSSRLMLDLGGFGISRYSFDNYLYRVAKLEGVSFELNKEVTAINFKDGQFEVEDNTGITYADLVIGSFGKRSRLDIQQKRAFIRKRSPWVGVKYHIRSNHPSDVVSLHNFSGGYCGVCNVEDGVTNLCYLTHRNNLRSSGDVREMEEEVLFRNPLIRDIFNDASFIFKRPEVINEISFETKAPVENHILMAGDAAGMITPVCGNGMAIAIHSAKILSELVIGYCSGRLTRESLEERYRKSWCDLFRWRLWFGRNVQHMFGHHGFSSLAVKLAKSSETISRAIVKGTHGKPF